MTALEPVTHPREPSSSLSSDADVNLLLLEVTLGGERLVDVLNAYEFRGEILVPLGEMARVLTVAVTVDQESRTASGFLLRQERSFRLDLARGIVIFSDHKESYDQRIVRWIDGDIYAPIRLLQRWWPIDFNLELAALRLNVLPRERLPLQAKLEREQKRKHFINGVSAVHNPGYPYLRSPYGILSAPFIDNTLALDLRSTDGEVTTNAAYSAFLTGDLLGMEAAAYLGMSKQDPNPDARITFARHDPDAQLLGPLRARSVMLGSIGVPAFENVLRGAGVGYGVLATNRPLNLPSSYRSQTLRGELPPGWDVTLYFNDALIGFQQARSDGLYEFSDQPLVYGRNEFRLVFNGPLGQTRVERQVFQLDQALTQPGEFFYTAAGQRERDGRIRQTLQIDVGIFKDTSVTLGGIYVDAGAGSSGRAYVNAGVRAAISGAMINIDHVREVNGGHLTEVGVRTSIAGVSIDATRVWMSDFHSEFFDWQSDPLKGRDRLRMTATVSLTDRLKLPMALDVERQQYASGREALEVQQRLSVNILNTSLTNMLEWHNEEGPDAISGVLQINRRVAGVGLSGQMVYSIQPQARLNSFAVTADKSLGDSERAHLGVLRDFDGRKTIVTAGLNRNFGGFGLGLSGLFADRRNYGIGIQFFASLHRDPWSGRVVSDWRPLAGSGMVAAQVFIDDNRNGLFDRGEDPVEGVGFKINGGGRHPARTTAGGVALLHRLTPKDYIDVELDVATLEDAQLQPAVPGVRLLPRPGRAQKISFPLQMTGEIDGTVKLIERGKSRGIGNALVELLDERGDLIGSTRSASDGFYVISGVRPGKYRLRISPGQTRDLGLAIGSETIVTMPADPDFISGIDLEVRRASLLDDRVTWKDGKEGEARHQTVDN